MAAVRTAGHADGLQVFDHRSHRQSQVFAAPVYRHRGVQPCKSLHMQLIDERIAPGNGGRPIAAPIEAACRSPASAAAAEARERARRGRSRPPSHRSDDPSAAHSARERRMHSGFPGLRAPARSSHAKYPRCVPANRNARLRRRSRYRRCLPPRGSHCPRIERN